MFEHDRILLVEDDRLCREVMIDYLNLSGYQIESLAGGANFFQTLIEFNPHLILLDLKLPDADGYTLLKQLQQAPKWQNIPVIVVSGFAFTHEQQRALNLGVRRYLIKPINLRNLLQVIQEEIR